LVYETLSFVEQKTHRGLHSIIYPHRDLHATIYPHHPVNDLTTKSY
jgi:hypothetical protein